MHDLRLPCGGARDLRLGCMNMGGEPVILARRSGDDRLVCWDFGAVALARTSLLLSWTLPLFSRVYISQ